jgi:hypothetical protein
MKLLYETRASFIQSGRGKRLIAAPGFPRQPGSLVHELASCRPGALAAPCGTHDAMPYSAYHEGVCGVCHARKNVAFVSAASSDVCSACYRKEFQPRATCWRCGAPRYVALREAQGPCCASCYQRFVNLLQCSGCRRRTTIVARIRHKALCSSCYNRGPAPREACALCDRVDLIRLRRDDGRPVCPRCYEGLRALEPCADCGRRVIAHARDAAGRAICDACRRRSRVSVCALCKTTAPLNARTTDGKRACANCYARRLRPTETCASCGVVAAMKRRLESGRGVCARCYVRDFAPKEPCVDCAAVRVVIARRRGAPVCGTCYKRSTSESSDICAACRKRRPVAHRYRGMPFCDGCHRLGRSKSTRSAMEQLVR